MNPVTFQSLNGKNKATLYYGVDVREALRGLSEGSVQVVCTSPPYFNLRAYLPEGHENRDKEIGLEPTPEAYVGALVEVFKEIWRVLRDDGSAWLNIGDSFWGGGSTTEYGNDIANFADKIGLQGTHPGGSHRPVKPRKHPVLKTKDLCGIPWRCALALQADGWYLRSSCIWTKSNALPSSVLDRPTSSHEYIFLLTKKPNYFYDAEAVKEPAVCGDHLRKTRGEEKTVRTPGQPPQRGLHKTGDVEPTGTRNLRDTWTIATKPYPGSHFAVFPPEIPEICIKAGTSEKGCCPTCGAPWKRVLGKKTPVAGRGSGNVKRKVATEGERDRLNTHMGESVPWQPSVTPTVGWEPTCSCDSGEPVPCTVLDPFSGSATTGKVAWGLGRDYIGIDLNEKYLDLAKGRLLGMPSAAFSKGALSESNPFKDLW